MRLRPPTIRRYPRSSHHCRRSSHHCRRCYLLTTSLNHRMRPLPLRSLPNRRYRPIQANCPSETLVGSSGASAGEAARNSGEGEGQELLTRDLGASHAGGLPPNTHPGHFFEGSLFSGEPASNARRSPDHCNDHGAKSRAQRLRNFVHASWSPQNSTAGR